MNADTLLKQANLLGTQSSNQTGVAFTPINSSSLTPTTPVTVPTPTPTPNPAAPIIASAQFSDAQAQKQAEATVNANNAGVTALQNERSGTLSKIKDIFSNITGAQTAAAQPNVAIDTANKDLANLNTQIADVNVAYRGESDANKGRGDITKEAQAGLQFNTDAKYGRQLADLAIRQSAANQNVTALTTAAERKLALTLAPLQTELSYYKDFVLNNIDSLTKDEKDKANAIIAEKQRLIDQHTQEQNIGTTAIKSALDNGVKLPDAVVAQITANPKNAYQILASNGISLVNPLDTQYKQAQISKLNSEARAAEAQDAAVNPDVLQGMLNVYKSTGVLPSFGMSGKSPLRAQFYAALGADGSIVTDANTNKTVRAGLTQAYKTQQNQLAANQTAISTLDQQLGLAKTYSDKVNRSSSPLIAKYVLGAKSGVFGDPDAAALNNIVKTASYEFAKILSGSAASVAGVTVSSAADAEAMLNSAMSKGQFNEVLGLMNKEANYRLNSQKDTLKQLESDLNDVGSLSNTVKDVNSGKIPLVNSDTKTVKVAGQDWVIGQLYQDGKGNKGTFDINGKWIAQ